MLASLQVMESSEKNKSPALLDELSKEVGVCLKSELKEICEANKLNPEELTLEELRRVVACYAREVFSSVDEQE